MQIFSTFESTSYLEMAISTLEKEGIKKESIFAVPLDNRTEKRRVFDSLHRSDGISLIDIGAALATAFSVIGASVGFKLKWGPIYWGLIGAGTGLVLGIAIRLFIELVVKRKRRLLNRKHSEIILIIDCEESQAEFIENVLWDHFALGVAKVQQI
ncbi:hypothetical protein P5G51_018815 [Virgibacillus sp. 179-BFC.A HS]|uniref:Uncharacterized protein n=1 Tax=Tigheibacillus jepli TaxID=3035914 RepID=A0ABU5CL78_9BACI|nr:hypothetical protein [Virgibacillus sp. 179-BFC.A HS]MDY0407113.1 hypothetical protein [Virgibacillus sp. 179-BFC.A HS]